MGHAISKLSHSILFSRFYSCVNGIAYELPCATSLVFDEAQGTCVRPEEASEYAKKCNVSDEKRKNFYVYKFSVLFQSLNIAKKE